MGLPFLLQDPPRSICILRLSALGDVTHVLPLAHTLQKAWPNAKITWVIGRVEAGLVAGLPGVELVVFEKRKGLKSFLALRQLLQNREFDLLLNLQAAFRASIASLFIKAPVKLGFDKTRARDFQWLFTNARIPSRNRQHVLDGFLEFAGALGVAEKVVRWDIPIPEEARDFADRLLPDKGSVLAINPCSSQRFRNWRNWRPGYYAAVADYAVTQHGMTVVLTGGPDDSERAFGRLIVENCKVAPINLIGETTLKQMLAVLARAAVLISPDTGPAHMASAVGTPVIGLYASSNPERTGPYRDLARVINKYPEALMGECGLTVAQADWGKRVRDPNAMDLIKPEEVTTRLDQTLGELKA